MASNHRPPGGETTCVATLSGALPTELQIHLTKAFGEIWTFFIPVTSKAAGVRLLRNYHTLPTRCE